MGAFFAWARTLRFKQLFLLTLFLLILNVLIVDPIPFIDEIILGLTTMLLGSLKKPEEDDQDRLER